VGPGHGNMRHGGAIGLTTGRMAVTAGSGRAPARAHGGGPGRWSRRRPLPVRRQLGLLGEWDGELRCILEEGAGWRSGDRRRWGGGAPVAGHGGAVAACDAARARPCAGSAAA
jgi:hypothetical protein